MPLSLLLSIVLAVAAGVYYAAALHDGVSPLNQREFFGVVSDVLSVATITAFLIVLWRVEKADAPTFAAAIRANIATVITALVLNLSLAIFNVVRTFGPAFGVVLP